VPPPTDWYEVSRRVAIDAALNIGGFYLILADDSEDERTLKLVPGQEEIQA